MRYLFAIFLFFALPFSAAQACTGPPAGVEGEIIFNTDDNVPAYCDGTNWIAMAGGEPDYAGPVFPNQYYVFVSEPLPNGNILGEAQGRGFTGTDGVLAGDYICQAEAEAAGLPGTYFAWLSGPDSDDNAPRDRFFQNDSGGIDYVMPNAPTFTKVADNWNDLINGNIDNNIEFTADGTAYTGDDRVWTNVDDDGRTEGTSHCLDWTSASSGESGRRGNAGNADNNWTNNGSSNCNESNRHIYCFQQPAINTQATQIVPNGLIGHWRLDETAGNRAFDSSGNGHDGIYNAINPSTDSIAGKIGNAIPFIAANDEYIRISDDTDFDLTSYTLSAWVKGDNPSDESGSPNIEKIVSKDFNFILNWDHSVQGGASCEHYTTSWQTTGDAPDLSADTWYHLACTYDSVSQNYIFYVNGTETNRSTGIAIPQLDTQDIVIGRWQPPNGTQNINGDIDDIRIYNRALSPTEIAEIYSARPGIRYNKSQRTLEYFDDNQFVAFTPEWGNIDQGPSLELPVAGCTVIGQVCSDGTVYVGVSPDGNLPMYTSAADEGTMRWANSSVTTGFNSNTDGDGNTAGLVLLAGTYDAAQACHDKSDNGHNDWYLPALNELIVLYNNNGAIGGFNTSNEYWSSSENSSNNAREVNFADGVTSNHNKGTSGFAVRCVRKQAWAIGTAGLVGHWKLDETEGTTAVDSSGNGNDGTLSGTGMDFETYSIKGAVGRALLFKDEDPTASYFGRMVNIPDINFSETDTFSMAAWFYPETGTDFGRLTGHSSNSHILVTDGSTLSYSMVTGLESTSTFPANQWAHFVLNFDGANQVFQLYINGVLEDTETVAPSSFTGLIGNFPEPFGGFDGAIDDLRVYDRILTVDEITALYQMGAAVGSSTALPQGCPNIGDVCDDGTIYAGLSPDGNVAMFAAPLSTRTNLPWNNGNSSNQVLTSLTDSNTGEANTNTLTITDSDSGTAGFQPHQAAQYCYDLVSNGADDWYLPANSEIDDVLAVSAAVDPATAGNYFSSNENDTTSAERLEVDSTGAIVTGGSWVKHQSSPYVLCARKGPAPRCANPYGVEGQIIYNTTHDVVQYCDGARWVGVGKYGP